MFGFFLQRYVNIVKRLTYCLQRKQLLIYYGLLMLLCQHMLLGSRYLLCLKLCQHSFPMPTAGAEPINLSVHAYMGSVNSANATLAV